MRLSFIETEDVMSAQAQMTDIDIRDLTNHVMHFSGSAIVHKRGRSWWVDFRGFGCPSPFNTKREAVDWANHWPSAIRAGQRARAA
jgi:hypothetical protein